MKNKTVHLLFLLGLLIPHLSYAVDATNYAHREQHIGHWTLIEFFISERVVYRLSADSINEKNLNIVFDLVPSKDCISSPAIMVLKLKSYANKSKEGMVIMEYKLPTQTEATPELVKTVISEGDEFEFLEFSKLTAKTLLLDNGNLAIWVPASGDGDVKRSENMYFPLDGFSIAYKEAKRLCDDKKGLLTK
jgi:hypothetical protein